MTRAIVTAPTQPPSVSALGFTAMPWRGDARVATAHDPAGAANRVKANYSAEYLGSDPGPYYRAMAAVDYQIAQNATATIRQLVAERLDGRLQEARSDTPVRVLDIGCSYGVLSALVNHDVSLPTLYARYADPARTASPDTDRRWFETRRLHASVQFHGLDTSENAIRYAREAGLLVSGCSTNLERADADIVPLAPLPDHVDLIVSTGCVGYVGERTFERVLAHLTPGCRPIIASFVHRAFDYGAIASMLDRQGYDTLGPGPNHLVQRRFSNAAEQQEILSLLRASGRFAHDALPEEDGYCRAALFVSRPREPLSVDISR